MSSGSAVAALDLRLVPPAVAAWCAALVVVHAPASAVRAVPAAVVALVVVSCAVAAAAARHVVRAARRTAAPRRTPPSRLGRLGSGPRAVAPAVVLAAVAAAAVLVSGAAGSAVRVPEAITAAADSGRTVEVVGRVAAAPRAGSGGDPRVRTPVAVSAIRVDGTWRRVRAVLEVVAPSGAPVDAVVRVHGVVREPSSGVSGRLRAGAPLRLTASEEPRVTAPPRPVQRWAARVRHGAHTSAAGLPPDVRGLLPAVTVGDTAGVPDDLVTAMRASGLAHVMAVSGAHFAILGTLVLAATAAVGLPRALRVAAAAAAGAGLLVVVGPEPSVVRAAVMGGVGLVGLLAGRRAAGPAALATAVLVLLVVDPQLAVDVGFVLSVAATAGLVVLGAPLVARWSARIGRDVAALLAAPVAAQLGCLPVTLALWPTLGPWAVAANLAVTPAVAPATVLGLLAALLAGSWPALAGVVAAGAGAACWWIAAVARCAAALPGAGLAWWPGVAGAVAALVVLVAAAVLVLRDEDDDADDDADTQARRTIRG